MIKVIKVGGNVIDNPAKLTEFLGYFSKIEGRKVMVHGGGKIASDLGLKLGLVPQMHEGKRITDAHTLKLVTMVYAGLINKDIVARLQSIGCNAIGLCGADGNTIPSVKRLDDKIDWGYVGDVDINEINYELIFNLLELGLQPVFSAITHDKMGNLMNTNADTIASSIANALAKAGKEVALVYCFEKKGVLRDVNDQSLVIKEIKTGDYADLKNSGVIHSGMIPKLDNAFKSIQAGVNLVKICMAEDLYDWENAGTSIKK